MRLTKVFEQWIMEVWWYPQGHHWGGAVGWAAPGDTPDGVLHWKSLTLLRQPESTPADFGGSLRTQPEAELGMRAVGGRGTCPSFQSRTESSAHLHKPQAGVLSSESSSGERGICSSLQSSAENSVCQCKSIWAVRTFCWALSVLSSEEQMPLPPEEFFSCAYTTFYTCAVCLWSQPSWVTQGSWLQRISEHVQNKGWRAGIQHQMSQTLVAPLGTQHHLMTPHLVYLNQLCLKYHLLCHFKFKHTNVSWYSKDVCVENVQALCAWLWPLQPFCVCPLLTGNPECKFSQFIFCKRLISSKGYLTPLCFSWLSAADIRLFFCEISTPHLIFVALVQMQHPVVRTFFDSYLTSPLKRGERQQIQLRQFRANSNKLLTCIICC